DMPIAAAYVHHAVHNCGGRLKADLIVNLWILPGFERPLLLAGVGVDCVEITVPASDVDRVVDHCRRSVYDVFGGELPLQNTGLRVRRVHVAITASKENLAVRQGWRGSEYVPSIRNRLSFGLKAVH